MKNIFFLLTVVITIGCKAQIYPLRNYIDIPENSYEKDTNNEFIDYEGIWKATWSNKIIYVSFSKVTNKYHDTFKYYRDFLIARFKVTDLSGNILFDNTNLSDDNVKIQGSGFMKINNKYSLIYIDRDLCMRTGTVLINFTDLTKTKLQWKYSQDENWIDKDCFYHGWAPADIPQPLPNDIILIKQ